MPESNHCKALQPIRHIHVYLLNTQGSINNVWAYYLKEPFYKVHIKAPYSTWYGFCFHIRDISVYMPASICILSLHCRIFVHILISFMIDSLWFICQAISMQVCGLYRGRKWIVLAWPVPQRLPFEQERNKSQSLKSTLELLPIDPCGKKCMVTFH